MNIFDVHWTRGKFGAFYGPTGDVPFSNYYDESFEHEGMFVDSAEHAYQRAKFINPAHFDILYSRHKLSGSGSGDSAKKAANEMKQYVRTDWMTENQDVMSRILASKFGVGSGIHSLLLLTRGEYLVEHTKKDSFWGDGGDGNGRNMLGTMLMRLRGDTVPIPTEYNTWIKTQNHSCTNGLKLCKCGKPVWIDPTGRTVSNFCSIRCRGQSKTQSHTQSHTQSQQVNHHRQGQGLKLCKCGKPVWIDPTGLTVSNFCSMRCRDTLQTHAQTQTQTQTQQVILSQGNWSQFNPPNSCYCGRPVWIDPRTGTASNFCSIGCRDHPAQNTIAHTLLQPITLSQGNWNQVNSSAKQGLHVCKKPGCGKTCYQDSRGVWSDACCRSHR